MDDFRTHGQVVAAMAEVFARMRKVDFLVKKRNIANVSRPRSPMMIAMRAVAWESKFNANAAPPDGGDDCLSK